MQSIKLLILEAYPQVPHSRLVVITIFTWCLSVNTYIPTFQKLSKSTHFHVRIVIAIGGNVGLSEWIVDNTHRNIILQALGNYTRTAPSKRIETLAAFAKRMGETRGVQEELNRWGMKFNPNLERVNARILKPENITHQGSPSLQYTVDKAAWGSGIR